jgi:acetamidase/formamidase
LAQAIDVGGVATYTIQVQASGNFSSPLTLTIQSPSALTYTVSPTTLTFPYSQAALVITDLHTVSPLLPGEWYTVTVTGSAGSITDTHSADVKLLVGGSRVYLPLVMK